MLQIQCAELTSVKELKNQVRDLQKQLSDTRTENKLLAKVQQRHMVALQHFQYSEGSHVQIVAKQENKAQGLKEIIRGVRACHVKLAKQLQTSENMLLKTKDSMRHLDLLSQDHTLLGTEELIRKLDKATAELDSKNKRILELENNLELCQASFSHQNKREKREAKEEQKKSCYLKETIQDLTQKIQDAEKQLAKLNIYCHRLQNGYNKKDRGNEVDESRPPEKEESFANENTITEVLENDSSDDNIHQNDTQMPSDNTEQSEEDPEEQPEEVCTEKELSELEDELGGQTEEQECQEPLVVEYPETEVPENSSTEDNDTCADISKKNCGCEENPEDQPEGSCTEEDVEQTEDHTHHICHIGHRFPRIHPKYSFKQTIENLHNGRPAYCSEDWTPCTRCQFHSSAIQDVMVKTSVKKPKAQNDKTEG